MCLAQEAKHAHAGQDHEYGHGRTEIYLVLYFCTQPVFVQPQGADYLAHFQAGAQDHYGPEGRGKYGRETQYAVISGTDRYDQCGCQS